MLKKYRCPICGVVAEIDKGSRKMNVIVPLPPPLPGARHMVVSFPTHPDCELAKDVDSVNLSKLEEIK